MEEVYLVTGGAGHLGTAVVQMLLESGKQVRILALDQERHLPKGPVEIIRGDVCNPASLKPFFNNPKGQEQILIHCAGIVSISTRNTEALYRVNCQGTSNIIEKALESRVKRMVYVSSVHAIPEKPKGVTITEVSDFSPDRVVGHYAKSKAIASASVMEACRGRGLPACVVHPSGIIGPYDHGRGHTTALLTDYCSGRLTASIDGGYDFVDVRDVAEGILSACSKGRIGEGYILSNRYFRVQELLELLCTLTGGKRISHTLPLWFLKGTASLCEAYYQWRGTPPLFTAYSIYTLNSNGLFSHDKADRELGYHTRDMRNTLLDTLEWLREQGRIQVKGENGQL